MGRSFYFRSQAERLRRLARDSAEPRMRESFLRLAEDFAARAAALPSEEASIGNAGSEGPDSA